MHWRFILIFGLALAVVACGDDDEQIQEQQPQEQVQRPPPPAAQATAEPEPEPVPEPEVEPEPMSDPLYTVQVGAFLNADSAVVQRERLASEGLPTWTEDQTVGGRMFHRVRVGAVRTGAEGRRLSEILTQRYALPIWVALVVTVERIPAGALEATQDVLGAAND